MPQKSNHDFKEIYPYLRVGALVSKRIKDIMTKNTVFVVGQHWNINKIYYEIMTFMKMHFKDDIIFLH